MTRFARRLLSCALVPFAALTATSVGACAGNAKPAARVGQAPAPAIEAIAPQPTVDATEPVLPEAEEPPVIILLAEGDSPPGAGGWPVTALGLPVTDGNGKVAFTGRLDNDGTLESFIWLDGEVLWRASEVKGAGPGGPSPLMGISDNANFVFQTLVGGKDALWSHDGLLMLAGQPAPGMGDNATVSLSRWPTMTPGGQAHWVSDFRDGRGVKGKGRVLYRSSGPSPGAIEVVLRSDDLVDGFPISRPFGLDLNYQVSDNGEHVIQVMELITGSQTDNAAVYLDGGIELREGDTASLNEVYERFSRVAVNDQGDYLAVAVTSAPSLKDKVIVGNGAIRLREGDLVDGITLSAQANTLAVTLDNDGRAAHLWSAGGFAGEYLFFACDANDLPASTLLFRAGGTFDLEDYPKLGIEKFRDTGHGPALWLGPGDRLYAEVSLLDKSDPDKPRSFEAIVGFLLPDCSAQQAATELDDEAAAD